MEAQAINNNNNSNTFAKPEIDTHPQQQKQW